MSKSIYQPLPGFLVLEPLEDTSTSNISLPENMTQNESAGVVIAVGAPFTFREGPQIVQIPSPVKIGDKIIYKNMATQRFIQSNGRPIFMVKWHDDPNWSDILCIIEE